MMLTHKNNEMRRATEDEAEEEAELCPANGEIAKRLVTYIQSFDDPECNFRVETPELGFYEFVAYLSFSAGPSVILAAGSDVCQWKAIQKAVEKMIANATAVIQNAEGLRREQATTILGYATFFRGIAKELKCVVKHKYK